MQYNDIRHPDPQTARSQAKSPQQHLVVFRDQSAGLRYLTRSTRTSEHSTTWEDGNIYPVVEVDLSSAAHFAQVNSQSRRGRAGRRGRRRELADTSA